MEVIHVPVAFWLLSASPNRGQHLRGHVYGCNAVTELQVNPGFQEEPRKDERTPPAVNVDHSRSFGSQNDRKECFIKPTNYPRSPSLCYATLRYFTLCSVPFHTGEIPRPSRPNHRVIHALGCSVSIERKISDVKSGRGDDEPKRSSRRKAG